MELEAITSAVRDTATVTRVFGEPYEIDGLTIIPVARLGGGGGGGAGNDPSGERGSGGGFGVGASPAGAYVVKDREVRYIPAYDVGQLAGRAALVMITGLLAWRSVARSRHRRKAKQARRR